MTPTSYRTDATPDGASVTNPFTPGPWLIGPLESPGPYRVIIGPPIPGAPFSAKLIAHVYSGPTDDRLIAAAPDLYEAVQHAHNEFIRYAKLHRAKHTDEGDAKACHNASMAEEMHRALAKARGQQVSA